MIPDPSKSTRVRALDRLVSALYDTSHPEMLCAECRLLLPEVYECDQGVHEPAEEIALAMLHVRSCRRCAPEYEALKAAMIDYESGNLPKLTEPPQFDLSFMTSIPIEPDFWIRDVVAGVMRLYAEVPIAITAAIASFADMPQGLTPQQSLLGTFRSNHDDDQVQQVQVLVLPAPEADVSIQISVGPVTNLAATIAVRVVDWETSVPIHDTRVALRNASRKLLVGSVTDQEGTTLLENLQSGRYFVQVRHHQETWEVPFVVIEESPVQCD